MFAWGTKILSNNSGDILRSQNQTEKQNNTVQKRHSNGYASQVITQLISIMY